MSAVIKTLTPFTELDVLVEALELIGVETIINGNRIETDRKDYQGRQYFIKDKDVYRLSHDSEELRGRMISHAINKKYIPVQKFLTELEKAYKTAWQNKLERIEEEERKRMEKKRQERVEKTRLQAIERAKKQGFRVRETRKNGNIQLVLTRTTY